MSPAWASAAVMMRPPRIRTDIADLPPSARCLFPTRCDRDLGLLPLAAVDVDALLLQNRVRGAREIGAVRLVPGDPLELVVLCRRLRGELVDLRINDPDAQLVRPDEGVDLVHLPRLVPLEQRRSVREDDVYAVLQVCPAVDPPFERRDEELLRDRLMRFALDPALRREDAVFEHPGSDVLHLDHVEVAELRELPRLRVRRFEHLSELVVCHRGCGVDLPP